MPGKRSTLLLVLAFALVAIGAAQAASAPTNASLVIRHQLHGCHSWSLNGGAFAPRQTAALRVGGSLTITDNDVMPHTLVQTGGPALAPFKALSHIGASMKVVFSHPGTYRFTTKAGEDYTKGVKTIGEDNVLRLTVTVS